MPSSCCSVPGCHERGGHQFPCDSEKSKKWVTAIRRAGDKPGKLWVPGQGAVVCRSHFQTSDYQEVTKLGTQQMKRKLLPSAVPSIFPWNSIPPDDSRKRRCNARAANKESLANQTVDFITPKLAENQPALVFLDMEEPESAHEEEVSTEVPFKDQESQTASVSTAHAAIQTLQSQPISAFRTSLEDYHDDPDGIQFYTGLKDINIVKDVFASLGPAVGYLNYIQGKRPSLPVIDQLFLTLIKLRQCKSNFELSRMFKICESDVYNIFVTWVRFMALQWREINIWSSKDMVKFFSPFDFKSKFPTTRVIVDGTEIPVKKPSAPAAQQMTFSSYKNRNTVKVLVGVTPGGQVSYVSPAYGGTTSDRQIVERGNLTGMCDPKDSIMADKGFDVQDIFAPYDVTINIPSFFKKQNRMTGTTVLKDRKIASKRVHVERLIGLGKTYKILCNPFNHTETLLASDIIYICYMLVNFRPCIVPRDA